jgi:hypothetical protein
MRVNKREVDLPEAGLLHSPGAQYISEVCNLLYAICKNTMSKWAGNTGSTVFEVTIAL